MTGRTIDQLFATHNPDDFGKPDHIPSERYVQWSAELHGPATRPQRHDYIWGGALDALDAAQPDFRLANLETAITTSAAWERKTFNFRMHPANVACLTALGFDCLSLANNHAFDFGPTGLLETMAVLQHTGIAYCGAGHDSEQATKPHVHVLPGGKRIVVFAWAAYDSGEPVAHWAAGPESPGVAHLATIGPETAEAMRLVIAAHRQPGDIVIVSLHWGRNWVDAVPRQHRALAHFLIDHAGVDLIHGHSSHHVLPVEIYKGKLVLYGCGDLINDTEARPDFRTRNGHLGALYFADLDRDTHRLSDLKVQPVERRRFRLEKPSRDDAAWVRAQLSRQL